MSEVHVNHFGILIAFVVYVLIGFVWYSRWLFGDQQEIQPKRLKQVALNTLVGLLSAYTLGILFSLLEIGHVRDGIFLGFLIWLGFVAPTQLSGVIWGKMRLSRFLIHTGCQLVSYLAMSIILSS